MFTLFAGGRVFVFEFELRTSGRFILTRGVALTLAPLFTFPRLMLAGRFVLPLLLLLALPLTLSFVFLGLGRFGLFSLVLDDEFVLRFSTGSSGVTFSGDSPSLIARLISIATV